MVEPPFTSNNPFRRRAASSASNAPTPSTSPQERRDTTNYRLPADQNGLRPTPAEAPVLRSEESDSSTMPSLPGSKSASSISLQHQLDSVPQASNPVPLTTFLKPKISKKVRVQSPPSSPDSFSDVDVEREEDVNDRVGRSVKGQTSASTTAKAFQPAAHGWNNEPQALGDPYPKAPTMDVDSFKRLLLTGEANDPLANDTRQLPGSSLSRSLTADALQTRSPPMSSFPVLEDIELGWHGDDESLIDSRDAIKSAAASDQGRRRASPNPRGILKRNSMSPIDKPLPPPPRNQLDGEEGAESIFDREAAGKMPELVDDIDTIEDNDDMPPPRPPTPPNTSHAMRSRQTSVDLSSSALSPPVALEPLSYLTHPPGPALSLPHQPPPQQQQQAPKKPPPPPTRRAHARSESKNPSTNSPCNMSSSPTGVMGERINTSRRPSVDSTRSRSSSLRVGLQTPPAPPPRRPNSTFRTSSYSHIPGLGGNSGLLVLTTSNLGGGASGAASVGNSPMIQLPTLDSERALWGLSGAPATAEPETTSLRAGSGGPAGQLQLSQDRGAPPPPPPARNSSLRRSNRPASSSSMDSIPMRLASREKEGGSNGSNLSGVMVTGNAQNGGLAAGAPPPPPPRQRGGSKGSVDGGQIGRMGLNPSYSGPVPAVEEEPVLAVEEERDGSIYDPVVEKEASRTKDILADLDALRQEVDALRIQQEKEREGVST